MKKTYMKPTMESETFVTNEFAQGCWKVTCNGFNSIFGAWLSHKKHGVIAEKLQNEPSIESIPGTDFYTDSNGTRHYDVDIINEATLKHPNHS